MPSANTDDTRNDNESQNGFSHVRIGSGSSVAKPDSAQESDRFIEVGDFEDDPWHEEAVAAARAASEAPTPVGEGSGSGKTVASDDPAPDYGLDDLPPMPLAQKIVLFLVILAIVVVVYFVLRYWIF